MPSTRFSARLHSACNVFSSFCCLICANIFHLHPVSCNINTCSFLSWLFFSYTAAGWIRAAVDWLLAMNIVEGKYRNNRYTVKWVRCAINIPHSRIIRVIRVISVGSYQLWIKETWLIAEHAFSASRFVNVVFSDAFTVVAAFLFICYCAVQMLPLPQGWLT